jgi:hypothetical protein
MILIASVVVVVDSMYVLFCRGDVSSSEDDEDEEDSVDVEVRRGIGGVGSRGKIGSFGIEFGGGAKLFDGRGPVAEITRTRIWFLTGMLPSSTATERMKGGFLA